MRLWLLTECDDDMCVDRLCPGEQELTDPDAILAALAEAGVLDRRVSTGRSAPLGAVRYVSPWKETR